MPEPLRALLISGEYPPMEGGVADYTHILGEEMAELGAKVHVLTSVGASRSPGDKVICHPLLRSWGGLSLRRALRGLVQQVRPQVINIQYQTAAYGMRPAINLVPSLLREIPSVVTFHDLKEPYLFPKAGPLRWWANERLARSANAVIVTNREDFARLAATAPISRLELIPIGSNIPAPPPDSGDRSGWRARWGVAPDALLLCYFGLLNESKGGTDLVMALDSLVRSGYNAVLCMIGGTAGASDPTNHAYLQSVRSLIDTQGLEDQVIWTGYLSTEEVSASFYGADVCVLPYRDGASFRRGSFMAALSHGMPIVTTRPRSELPELRDGENSLLVSPADPEGLAQAVARLTHEPALVRQLGEGARALASQFDWRQIAARTLEVYYDIAAP